MTDGTSQGLFIVVAIVIFGIFVVLAYILFEDTLSPALANMFTNATETASERLHSNYTDARFFDFDSSTGTILNYRDDDLTDDKPLPMDVRIPETIDGVDVRVIGSDAFYRKGITSVIFPNNLESIEDGETFVGAFAYNELTSIKFPKKLTNTGHYTFVGNNISRIDYGNIEIIGANAFNGNNLTEINVPGTVKTIYAQAFMTNNASKVVLNEGIEIIGSFVFWDNDLKSLRIPSTVTTLESGLVAANYNFEELIVPSHLKPVIDSNINILVKKYIANLPPFIFSHFDKNETVTYY